MTTISKQMIVQGAAVKDTPSQNVVDLVLSTTASEPGPTKLIAPIIQTNVAEIPIPTALPNIMQIDTPPADNTGNNNGLILAGLGIGALLLFSGKKQTRAAGIGKKKKSSLLPLVVVAGVAGYYWYTQQQGAAVTPPPSQTPDPSLTQVNVNPLPLGTTSEPTPGSLYLGPGEYLPAGYIATSPEVTVPANDNDVYNAIFNYSDTYKYGIDRMSVPWRRAFYQYIFGYMKKGLRVYAQPGYYMDGWYDADLYNTVVALSAPWGWHLVK